MVILNESDQFTHLSALKINAIVIITDIKDKITYVNPYAEKLLGSKSSEILNHSIRKYIRPRNDFSQDQLELNPKDNNIRIFVCQ